MPRLETWGSPTFNADSSCSIDATGADRVMVPDVSLLNATQMWIALRVKPTWASTDTNERTFFRWGPNTNDELFIQYGPTAGQSNAGRDGTGGGSGPGALVTGLSFSANTDHTVIAAWDSANVKISWDGVAFTSALDSHICLNSASTVWDIGQRGYSFSGIVDAAFHWVAAGKGTLTDANASTIHALGNTDPGLNGFPVATTFYWNGANIDYEVQPSVDSTAWLTG